ncbi:MAG: AraC family transcriptional regulator [Verrucomicrobiota bacterium]|nr:AraC family transcriptional regulator [Verrucomicrobiota bacterium]
MELTIPWMKLTFLSMRAFVPVEFQKLLPSEILPSPLLASFFVCHVPHPPERFKACGIQFCFIVEGQMTYKTSSGHQGTAEKGDLVAFYPGINEYTPLGPIPMSFFQVHFESAPAPRELWVPYIEDIGFIPVHIKILDQFELCCTLFEKIIMALHRLNASWRLETASALLDLISLAFNNGQIFNRDRSLPESKMDKMIARMEKNSENVSISRLAKEYGINSEYFIRLFRRHTGVSPKKYILQRRLWKGRAILQSGGSVKEASFAAGFKDPLYFSRQYRGLFGFPPSHTKDHSQHAGFYDKSRGSLPFGRHLIAPGIDYTRFSA